MILYHVYFLTNVENEDKPSASKAANEKVGVESSDQDEKTNEALPLVFVS